MSQSITRQHLQRIVTQVDPFVEMVGFRPLVGGVSTQTVAIDVMRDNQRLTWVLRAHGDVDRQRNPRIAHDEYQLLQYLYKQGLSVPEPIFVDMSCEVMTIPYLLTAYIMHDGVRPVDVALPLANMLARIHRVVSDNQVLSFVPDARRYLRTHLDDVTDHPILNALQRYAPRVMDNAPVLLHGDFWQGNVLWHDKRIVSVIDWEDMLWGDPLIDLGKSRLELWWQSDFDTMQAYSRHYQAIMPHIDMRYLAYWDLWGAWRLRRFSGWFDDAEQIRHMQDAYQQFVNEALYQLNTLD